MSKKAIVIIAVAFTVLVLLSACLRSVGPSFLATPTAKGSIPTATSNSPSQPSATPTGMTLMQIWGTTTASYVQTAVALGTFTPGPSNGAVQPSVTPIPASATPTSLLPGTGVPTSAPGSETSTPATGAATSIPGSTAVIVVATATPGRPASYTLHKGEFPYCLARRFNVDPNTLLQLNGLNQSQSLDLQPGLTLQIPQTGSFPGTRFLHSHPTSYNVQVGDTFYSIACYFGDIDPTAIAAANGLSLTSTLVTGKSLSIP